MSCVQGVFPMVLQKLWNRPRVLMPANRMREAALAILFLVSCCIWIPIFARAVAPQFAVAAALAPSPSAKVMVHPVAFDLRDSAVKQSEGSWDALTRMLAEDVQESGDQLDPPEHMPLQ